MSVGPAGPSAFRVTSLFDRALVLFTGRTDLDPVARRLQERMRDGIEPSTALLLMDLDRLFGRLSPENGFVPPPGVFFGVSYGNPLQRRGYNSVGQAAGQGEPSAVARSIQAALEEDPLFRERLQAALGGRLLPGSGLQGQLLLQRTDGRVGGGVPVFAVAAARPVQGPGTTALNAAARAQGMPQAPSQMGSIMNSLQQMEDNVKALALSMGGQPAPGSAQNGTGFSMLTGAVTQTAAGMDLGASALGSLPLGPTSLGPAAGGARGADGLSETAKMQILEHQMKTLKTMYEMLANILSTMNEMQQTAIKNIA